MNRSLGRNWLRVQIETWYVIEIANVSLKVLLVFISFFFDRDPWSFFHFGSSRFSQWHGTSKNSELKLGQHKWPTYIPHCLRKIY